MHPDAGRPTLRVASWRACVKERMHPWLRATRFPFFTATIVPVLLGTAVAWDLAGAFNPALLLLTLAGALFIHLGTNLANDYFDHTSGNDEVNKRPTPFSGGSRVIQQGLIRPRSMLAAALLAFAAGSALGLYLAATRGIAILWLGLLGVFLGLFYTASPLRLGYRGIGDLAVGVGFGPLIVLGAFFVQAQAFSLTALLISIPVGLLIAMVLFINGFPDYEADKKTGKKTLIVLLGKAKAVRFYHAMLSLAYLLIVAGAALRLLPLMALLALLTLPLYAGAVRISRRSYAQFAELLPANAKTIQLHVAFGLLLAAAFILDKVVVL